MISLGKCCTTFPESYSYLEWNCVVLRRTFVSSGSQVVYLDTLTLQKDVSLPVYVPASLEIYMDVFSSCLTLMIITI